MLFSLLKDENMIFHTKIKDMAKGICLVYFKIVPWHSPK